MTPNMTESQQPDPKKIEDKKPDARPPEAVQPDLAQTRATPPDAYRTQIAQPASKKAEDKLLDEDWLADKSNEDLVELMAELALELKTRMVKRTEQIAPETTDIVFKEAAEAKEFVRMPAVARLQKAGESADTTWRVVLISSKTAHRTLALEIHDDATVGRNAEGITVDLDLSEHDADALGVSRLHGMLLPEYKRLLVSDLASTNGTYVNQSKIDATQAIKDGDTISFGNLHFKLRIVSQPGASNK